jgi:AcrR family transcriptional regulator
VSSPEDLTARARIRDAAMRHFAEQGFERATIRGIAETAGVSSGLVRHHFGSKEALRDACDEHVLRIARKLNEDTWAAFEAGDLGSAAAARVPLGQFNRYIARSLIDGGSGRLFDEITRLGEAWIRAFDARREDEPDTDARVRAAVVAAWGLALPMMLEHLSRVMPVPGHGGRPDHPGRGRAARPRAARAVLPTLDEPGGGRRRAGRAERNFR